MVLYIIIIILLSANLAQHQWQELRRDAAVRNINNPTTEEHNKLAEIIVKFMDAAFSQGKALRQSEHANQTAILIDIRNDISQMLETMRNGTQ